jgi:hypothetical protein
MMRMGHYKIKPPITYKFFAKENICIRTNGMLKNGLICLYQDFQFDVINTSTTCTTIHHELHKHLLYIKSTFTFQ